jgi:hypothetical protein
MEMLQKVGVALVAIVGLTVTSDAMAGCGASWQGAWWSVGPQYRTLSCQNIQLADFQLNTRPPPSSYVNAVVNLKGGTWSQILGLTQSGAYVQGCDVDDLVADNVPVYLNWSWGKQAPQCSQAFIAYLAAGKQP